MLPLWIIDITSAESERRRRFLSLLGSIEHVYIDEDTRARVAAEANEEGQAESVSSVSADEHTEPPAATESSEKASPGSAIVPLTGTDATPVAEDQTLEERQEKEAKQLAAKNALIRGDYWYYSSFKDYFAGVNTDKEENIEKTAERLYRFQEDVIDEGKRFIKRLRESNVHPYQTVNVVILGDSTEDFSRNVFPSIAAILQKEKGRILPSHIHQGMCIFGALYVPCNINSLVVKQRSKILRMLQEIEVQHNLTEIRGYDHMMLYQNVQNRTQCSYSLLDEGQQAEYLMQCLIHLFFACNNHHPLISGTSSDDTFYFSMGATSLYFDMELEDKNDVNIVAHYLVQHFKESGEQEQPSQDYKLLDMTMYRAESFVGAFADISRLDIENYEPESPSPHPIADFMKNKLKKLYYGYYLRFFPATLLSRIIRKVEDNTSALLDRINAHCQSAYKAAEMSMLPAITRIIQKVTEQDGATDTIDNEIRQMQEQMSKEKSRIREVLEHNFWDRITDSANIPENQRQHFEEYHDVYKSDIAAKNGGFGCEQMKREATDKLKRHLSGEKTMMSTLARCLLLGIILVLSVLPVLSMVSPKFIDLGDVRGNAMVWSFGLFMLPVMAELIMMWLYLRKKGVLMRILRAYYTHDAYARIANRIESEAGNFYGKMIALGEEYLKRTKRIKREVTVGIQGVEIRNPFPETMFNQPLNGGQFDGEEIVPESEVESSKILVNHRPRIIRELTKPLYYLLINHLNDELAILYKDVRVTEDHTRRLNEETGEYEFVSRDELEAEREAEWQADAELFYAEIRKSIYALMVPREYPTVGEMINQYKRKNDNIRLLEPMIAYAATNGEITSDADTEYADVKVNVIDEEVLGMLPIYNTRLQADKYDELYKKFIFVTRWRCFDHFAFNRILPTEDFDQSVREIRIYEEEEKKRKRKRREEKRRKGLELSEDEKEQQTPYMLHTSSLILWAVCPDDNSGEWLRLFEAEYFSRAFSDREKLRKVLNQED
ncbi:MAG: hypothetical protein IJ650_01380 [Paludibacteraceae bacterium]|nr:hypothetical protein [Paludibacteraceae bacterium]